MKKNQCNQISKSCLASVLVIIYAFFFNSETTFAQGAAAGGAVTGPRTGFSTSDERSYRGSRFYDSTIDSRFFDQRRVLPFFREGDILQRDRRIDRIEEAELTPLEISRLERQLFGWQVIPHITLEETYSDNITLAPSGLEEGDFATVITPGISIRNNTRRFNWALDYSLQNIIYADHSDANDSNHLFNLDTLSEIIDDHLFMNFRVNLSPRNTSNIGAVAFDNISITENRSDVLTYTVNPYWEQRLGNFAHARASYSRNEVSVDSAFGSAISGDSTADTYRFDLASGSAFTRMLWELSYDDRRIEFEDDFRDTEFRTIRGDLRYVLTHQFSLLGALGYDDNQFESGRGDIDGILWNVGALWTPTIRTSVEGRVGERFFGTDVFFELSHRTRRTQWLVNYTQVPTTTRAFLLEQQVFPLFDQFGQPVINPNTGEPAALLVDIPTQTAEVLIRERFQAAVQYVLSRNIFSVNGYLENRDFEVTNRTEDVSSVNASWVWNIGPKTRSLLSLGRIANDVGGVAAVAGTTDDIIYIAHYELTRLIGSTMEASIGARYLTRDSDQALREFDEARIFVRLFKTF